MTQMTQMIQMIQMNKRARHKSQRSARIRLKADAHELLERLRIHGEFGDFDKFYDEIDEMKRRLQPKPGVRTRIHITGYTQ